MEPSRGSPQPGSPGETRCPLGWSTRAALFLSSALGAAAVAVCGAELAGVVPLGRFTRSTSHGEPAVAVVVGAVLVALGLTSLLRTELACSDQGLSVPRFLPWGSTETIPLGEIVRHGAASQVVRGSRQTHLLVRLRDGSERSVRVSLFCGGAGIVGVLTSKLGRAASPVTWHLGEPQFEDDS